MDSRREFIKKSATVIAGCCCLGATQLLTSCKSTIYVNALESGNALKINKKDFLDQNYIVVNSKSLSSPVYLKREKDEFKALSMHCTHKGCTVKPAGSIMVCPCHGAEFSNEGKVLGGPARENLKEYIVEVKGEVIEIIIK